jgi:hypothetical protein
MALKGHGFSRAAKANRYAGFQPLRDAAVYSADSS